MQHRIRLKNVQSEGPFDIYTLSQTSDQFVIFENDVPKDDMLKGKIITIPDDTRQLKVINGSPCCADYEVVVNISAARPTPTPTATPTPTPTATAIAGGNETNVVPVWLKRLAISSNSASYDVSLFVLQTQDIQIRVQSLTGDPISGFTFGGVSWNNNTWIEGTYSVEGGYNESFPVNPISTAYGGLIPGQSYKFSFRRANDNSVVYVRTIKIPATTQALTEIDLNTTPVASPTPTPTLTPTATSGQSLCSVIGRPPTISSITSSTVSQTIFQFDANNVPRFWARIEQNGITIRQTEMVYFANATPDDQLAAASGLATPTVQIFSNNTPTFKYATLTDVTNLKLAIEGSSCKSDPSLKTLTISAPVPTPTITPTLTASQAPSGNTTYIKDGKRITVLNGKTYAVINSQFAKLTVLPSGNVKLTTAASRASDNGTACLPLCMMSYMNDSVNGELAALKSATGLAMPKKTRLTIYIYWTNPSLGTSLATLTGINIWNAWGNPLTARNNNGGIDWVSIEVY